MNPDIIAFWIILLTGIAFTTGAYYVTKNVVSVTAFLAYAAMLRELLDPGSAQSWILPNMATVHEPILASVTVVLSSAMIMFILRESRDLRVILALLVVIGVVDLVV